MGDGIRDPVKEADGLPSHREPSAVIPFHQVPEPDLDQLGHTRHRTQRADSDQLSDPLAIGIFRRTRQGATTSQVRQPGPGGIEADIQQYLVVDKNPASETKQQFIQTRTLVLAALPEALGLEGQFSR